MAATRFVGWFCDPEVAEVAAIAKSGANAVALGPYSIMAKWNDSDAGTVVAPSTQMVAALQAARAHGLKVVLKPIIDCRSYAGDPNPAGWRAAINPSNIAAWMQDYWVKCFRPYLSLVDVVAIHTELATISAIYPQNFIELIQEIRLAGFSGPVTTSNDFNPLSSPYWTALDMIGGDAYPEIRMDTVAHAAADWAPLAQQAAVANAQTGCNVFFGELAPNAGTAMTAAQTSVVYQAFWEVFGPLEFWAGAIAWRWPQNGGTPPAALISGFAGGRAAHPSYLAPQATN
jgi:Glycoside Hydrolase Family 113